MLLLGDWTKRPIKREELVKRLLAGKGYDARKRHRGLVSSVLDEARAQLRDVFGFDLVALRKPPKLLAASAAAAATSKGRRKKQAAAGAPGIAYALVNALSDDEKADSPAETTAFADDMAAARLALLTAVLGIVVLANGAVPEDLLFAQLQKLGIRVANSADAAGASAAAAAAAAAAVEDPVFGDVRKLVRETFCGQQYLVRRKAATGNGVKEYEMGPRSLAEFSRRKTLEFVAHVFGLQQLDPILADAILGSQGNEPIAVAAPAPAVVAIADQQPQSAAAAVAESDSDVEELPAPQSEPLRQRRRR